MIVKRNKRTVIEKDEEQQHVTYLNCDNFDQLEQVAKTLNENLPRDIRVIAVRFCKRGYSPRMKTALRKYCYAIPRFVFDLVNDTEKCQREGEGEGEGEKEGRGRRMEKSIEAMTDLMKIFLGFHNFSNFTDLARVAKNQMWRDQKRAEDKKEKEKSANKEKLQQGGSDDGMNEKQRISIVDVIDPRAEQDVRNNLLCNFPDEITEKLLHFAVEKRKLLSDQGITSSSEISFADAMMLLMDKRWSNKLDEMFDEDRDDPLHCYLSYISSRFHPGRSMHTVVRKISNVDIVLQDEDMVRNRMNQKENKERERN